MKQSILIINLIILLTPLKGLLALISSDFIAKIIISLFLIVFSFLLIYLNRRKFNFYDLEDKISFIYLLVVVIGGLSYSYDLFFKGIYSIFVLILPIISIFSFRVSDYSLLKKNNYIIYYASSLFGLGYLLNNLGFNFHFRSFSSALGDYRFSSFYGATTVSALWSLLLIVFLLIKLPKDNKLLWLYSMFIISILLYGVIMSFQRNAYGALLIVIFGILTWQLCIFIFELYSLITRSKLSKKGVSAIFNLMLSLIIVFNVLNLNTSNQLITDKIFNRINNFSDKSQSKRSGRHVEYGQKFKNSDFPSKLLGIYPSTGNAGNAFSNPDTILFGKATESYFLKLKIERGYIGLITFSILLVVYKVRDIILLKSFLLNKINYKNDNIRNLFLLNSLSFAIIAVLFNLQYLDTPLGSLLFALIFNETNYFYMESKNKNI